MTFRAISSTWNGHFTTLKVVKSYNEAHLRWIYFRRGYISQSFCQKQCVNCCVKPLLATLFLN